MFLYCTDRYTTCAYMCSVRIYKEGIKNVNSKVISLFVQKVFYKSFYMPYATTTELFYKGIRLW